MNLPCGHVVVHGGLQPSKSCTENKSKRHKGWQKVLITIPTQTWLTPGRSSPRPRDAPAFAGREPRVARRCEAPRAPPGAAHAPQQQCSARARPSPCGASARGTWWGWRPRAAPRGTRLPQRPARPALPEPGLVRAPSTSPRCSRQGDSPRPAPPGTRATHASEIFYATRGR